MEIRSTATSAEVREAVTLLRSRYFWLKFIVANWYACTIAVIIIAVNVNLLVSGKSIQLGPSAGLLAFAVALLVFS
jgi:hypothetical protein